MAVRRRPHPSLRPAAACIPAPRTRVARRDTRSVGARSTAPRARSDRPWSNLELEPAGDLEFLPAVLMDQNTPLPFRIASPSRCARWRLRLRSTLFGASAARRAFSNCRPRGSTREGAELGPFTVVGSGPPICRAACGGWRRLRSSSQPGAASIVSWFASYFLEVDVPFDCRHPLQRPLVCLASCFESIPVAFVF